MMNIKKHIGVLLLAISLLVMAKVGQSQVFYIGFNTGSAYSWFNSPKFDNAITSHGYGLDLGFYFRYGKRPYYQVGFDWTRSQNNFIFEIKEADFKIEDKVPFNNFDFSFKIGYEIVQTPMFKWKTHAGPFIGRSLLFTSNEFDFDNSDFKNPQYGIIAGTGIQFTNLVIEIEYSYHISGLLKPVDVDGYTVEFGSNLQLITLKVGFQF